MSDSHYMMQYIIRFLYWISLSVLNCSIEVDQKVISYYPSVRLRKLN
jgi:hypothetical protein